MGVVSLSYIRTDNTLLSHVLDIAFGRRPQKTVDSFGAASSQPSNNHHHKYNPNKSCIYLVARYHKPPIKIMPRPNYTLYVPEASFRAFAILIAAEYNGVTINVNTDISNASKSPVRKLPILELNDGETCIFSSQASTRYVASIRHDVGLMGQSAGDAATIDAWMDWCTADIELPACVWFYPVAGYMPFNAAAYVF